MDRRPPRENNYRPGERYSGRSPPRRGRTPPGDRPFPVRGGPPYSRGPSPGRPPRYRSRSPYRHRDGPGGFRPRSPPRGPGRPRSPPPRRFSRSPPPRGPPPRRPSPSTYRPRSPPLRDGRYSGPGRDDRREFGGHRDETSRYSRENSYRPRDASQSPHRGSGPASKVASADSSRMPSPHVHPDRLRQNISGSPAPGGSPASFGPRNGPPPRRSSPYRPRERSPLPPRSPRQSYRDRLPPGPRDSPRRASPPRRDRSPPPRLIPRERSPKTVQTPRDRSPPPRQPQRERSPPKGPASDRGGYRDRPSVPPREARDANEQLTRIAPKEETSSPWGDRQPPPGPRVRDEEVRAPPSGPRNAQYDQSKDSGPPTGPSTPYGPAAMSRGSPFTPRGRGSTPFGRGRGEPFGGPALFGRGRGRGAYVGVPPSESPVRDMSGTPTGPRNATPWGDGGGSAPPTRPSLRGNHTSSNNTYQRPQRYHNYLAGLPQIVEGGRKLPSGLNPADEKRLMVLDNERERLYKEIDEKQRRKRAAENEYSKAERDAVAARLRTDLAEQALDRLGGEGGTATAY